MIPCNKRQKIVKQPSGLTIHRCMNKQCGVNGQQVDEETCERCPVRSVQRKRPCKDIHRPDASREMHPPATSKDMLEVTNEEVMEMLADAGMELSPEVDGVESIEYPSTLMQLWSYKEALIKWNKAGRPTRTQEEVENLHATRCLPCEWYDPDRGRCKGCGCAVTVGSIAVLNKIKMGTEHCPQGKW